MESSSVDGSSQLQLPVVAVRPSARRLVWSRLDVRPGEGLLLVERPHQRMLSSGAAAPRFEQELGLSTRFVTPGLSPGPEGCRKASSGRPAGTFPRRGCVILAGLTFWRERAQVRQDPERAHAPDEAEAEAGP